MHWMLTFFRLHKGLPEANRVISGTTLMTPYGKGLVVSGSLNVRLLEPTSSIMSRQSPKGNTITVTIPFEQVGL